MIKVNIQEAKTHLSRYIDQVEQGAVVIVCRHNQPVAELRAVGGGAPPPVRRAGLLKGRVQWDPDAFLPMTDQDVAEFDAAAVWPRADLK